MNNLSELTRKNLNVILADRAPGHKWRATAPSAIDAMTITQLSRRRMQSITESTTQTAAFDR